MTPLLLLTILTLISLAAPRYGVDSRWRGPSRPDDPAPPLHRRHSPASDLAALLRLVRSAARAVRG
jgi:hypothetical protein